MKSPHRKARHEQQINPHSAHRRLPGGSGGGLWLGEVVATFGLVLVIFRIQHATRARGLILLALAASLPPVLLLLSSGVFYTPWSWLPRIVTQFAAGAVACAAVRRLRPTLTFPPGVASRARRLAAAGVVTLLAQQLAVVVTLWLANRRGGPAALNV